MRLTWLVMSAAVMCPGLAVAQAVTPSTQTPHTVETVASPLAPAALLFFHAAPGDRQPSVLMPAPAAWTEDERGMPAWLKWGLVGGAGTAALAALLSGISIDADPPGAGESAAKGFAIGFVTIGGGVALYQFICAPGGWSRRNGLCDRARSRR